MNSDPILRELNRIANDQQVKHLYRNTVVAAMNHIKLQDQELLKLRDDVSQWDNPDDDPPPAA